MRSVCEREATINLLQNRDAKMTTTNNNDDIDLADIDIDAVDTSFIGADDDNNDDSPAPTATPIDQGRTREGTISPAVRRNARSRSNCPSRQP